VGGVGVGGGGGESFGAAGGVVPAWHEDRRVQDTAGAEALDEWQVHDGELAQPERLE